MSTYDGAYSNWNHDQGARVCSCKENNVNDFCMYHGKYGDRSFKGSEEYNQLIVKIAEQYDCDTD